MTVPGRQTRLRSLRTRSTIITFSDRFLADRSSSAQLRGRLGRVAVAPGGALDRLAT